MVSIPSSSPPTPPLNPLDHFLVQDEAAEEPSIDARLVDPDLIPGNQRHSIINERAVIRYFLDPTKSPELIETEKPSDVAPVSCVDVSLLLDCTNGCGGKIWPAAQVLGAYLTGRRDDLAARWKGKKILELGSGTGLVGFVVAKMKLGTETWVTDQDAMLDLMKSNLSLNPNMDPCHVAELNWGEPLPSDVPSKPDVLLLADCVYLEAAFQPLVDTMLDLCTPETEILFCYQKRRKADKRFFVICKKRFTMEEVADDDPARTEKYTREGTRLYSMRRKA